MSNTGISTSARVQRLGAPYQHTHTLSYLDPADTHDAIQMPMCRTWAALDWSLSCLDINGRRPAGHSIDNTSLLSQTMHYGPTLHGYSSDRMFCFVILGKMFPADKRLTGSTTQLPALPQTTESSSLVCLAGKCVRSCPSCMSKDLPV